MIDIKSLVCLAALLLAMAAPVARAAGMPPTGNFVSVRVNNGHIAYGAILSPTKILVPAHVVSGIPGNYSILAGSTDRSVTTCATCQLRVVARIVRHPGYTTGGGYSHDVAIIHLASALGFNATVFGSTIAAPFSNAVGTQFTQIGYENGGNNYNRLQTTATAPWTLATMPGYIYTPGAFVTTTSNTVLHGMITYHTGANQLQVAMKLSDYAAWISAN